MFGPLGFQEVLLILALALLIFGPRELPKIGRTIGRAMGEFRKASTELKRSLNTEMIEEELRQNDPRKLVRETAKELEAAAMGENPDSAPSDDASDPPPEDAPPSDEEPEAAPAEGPVTVPRDSSAKTEDS